MEKIKIKLLLALSDMEKEIKHTSRKIYNADNEGLSESRIAELKRNYLAISKIYVDITELVGRFKDV